GRDEHSPKAVEIGIIRPTRPISGGPLDNGFDRFFGTACCPTTDWLYAFIDGNRVPVPPTKQLDRGHLPKHPYANDNRPGMLAPDFDLEEVDLVLLDPSLEKTITLDELHADSDYSIWEGFACRGYPVITVLRGKLIVEHGKLTGSTSDGEWLPRQVSDAVRAGPAV
ncbi:MAG: hypothetical protein IH782_05260, partial [candidate division NC10 bacterium]|nr:hypothetical protein [candidate division NC10 bacterium]